MAAFGDIFRQPRLGLALGGGAARGLAHIGVLSVLEEERIVPYAIGGVSFGAFVGAVYAHLRSAPEVAERFKGFLQGEAFRESRLHFFIQETDPEAQGGFFAAIQSVMRRGMFYTAAMRREGYLAAEEFAPLVHGTVPEIKLQELGIPFLAVAADLHSGEEIVLERGSARQAIKASCAIPGVMPPVEFDGRLLVDGGAVRKLTGNHLRRRGCDAILGIDVSRFPELDPREKVKGLDVIMRSYAIKDERLRALGRAECDLVIRVPVEEIHWADFSRIDDAIAAGREAAKRSLPQVRRLLAEAGRPGRRLRRWKGNRVPIVLEP